MRHLKYTIGFLAGLLALLTPAWAEDGAALPRRTFVIGEQYSLYSELLGEERTFWISLPQSYSSSQGYREYPVLYALDGNLFFHQFSGVVTQLSSDATPLMPEMIVVGVDSLHRLRDSTPTHSLIGPDGKASDAWAASGGGEAFQQFLEQELVPYIDGQFATSEYRVLAGYSLTGLPVVYNLFTRPDMFDAHIVLDGSIWWDGFSVLDLAREALAERSFDGHQLAVITSVHRYPAPYITVEAGGRELVRLIGELPSAGLNVVHLELTDETHHSLALQGLYQALVAIFDGHAMTLDELYLRPEEIPARFERLSARLGVQIRPPEGLMNFFGYNFLRYLPEQEVDKALIYFVMNAENYPGSANAWASLGEAYLEAEKKPKAKAAFGKALALDPANEKASRGLAEIARKPK